MIDFRRQKEGLIQHIAARLRETGMVIKPKAIHVDGYIMLQVDLPTKYETLGEFGYWRCIDGFYDKFETIDEIIEDLKEQILCVKTEEEALWSQALSKYEEKFQDVPKENRPKGRVEAIAYRHIYRTLGVACIQ